MVNHAKSNSATKPKMAVEAALDAKNARQTDGEAIRTLLPGSAKKKVPPSKMLLDDAAAGVKARYLRRLEYCAAMRIGETRYHAYVAAGLIKPVRVGRTVLVPISECDALIERLKSIEVA